jgi:DNA-binding response OmpR family regulator
MELAKVLIVDDNKDLALALELRLRANNYHIMLAHDGISAFTLALAQKPIAMILDLYLPNEDGFAVMERFRCSLELSSVPVIIASADSSMPTQQRVLLAGARAFLEKPVDHRLLLSMLSDIRLGSQNQNLLNATSDHNPF